MSLSMVFGHADDGHAAFVQSRRDAERVIAADGDQRVDFEALEIADDLLDLLFGRIGARGAEDRAAEMQDARTRAPG